MSASDDSSQLRLIENVRSALIGVLSNGTWDSIEEMHRKVGLPWRLEFGPGSGKPRYVRRALEDLSDDEVIALARETTRRLMNVDLHSLENALLWLDCGGVAKLTEVTRLEIADVLEANRLVPDETPNATLERFARFDGVERRFEYTPEGVVEVHTDLFGDLMTGHTKQRRRRATVREVLDAYGFRKWPDKRVIAFIDEVVHPKVRRGNDQLSLVRSLNVALAADGFELIPSSEQGGHPVFSLQPTTNGVGGRPKNLIFASKGPHPEIGFADAVNNDIVILRHAEHCLVYDWPISPAGLRWSELAEWWAQKNGLDVGDVANSRKQLGARLQESLRSSPAEQRFFAAYFTTMRGEFGDDLPALIPQVFLHYDPVRLKELRARGEGKRFDVQRMDFLLLLPHGARVVIEIDGQQHYSTGVEQSARPSPERYAETVRSDRDLRLSGYEVFRFAGYELRDEATAKLAAQEFFTRLFRRHNVVVANRAK